MLGNDSHGFAILADTEEHLLALRDDLFLMHLRASRAETTAEGIRRAGDQVKLLHPAPVLRLVVITAAASPPSAALRAEFARVLLAQSRHMRAEAFVADATGFRGAMLRSVVTGLKILARSPVPSAVFDATPSALEWLLAHRTSAAPARDAALARAVDVLVGRVEAR